MTYNPQFGVTISGGEIGDFSGLPIATTTATRQGSALFLPGWAMLMIHPEDFYRMWGRGMWRKRLEGHPSCNWVAYGCPGERWERWGVVWDLIVDWLLPGWRTR